MYLLKIPIGAPHYWNVKVSQLSVLHLFYVDGAFWDSNWAYVARQEKYWPNCSVRKIYNLQHQYLNISDIQFAHMNPVSALLSISLLLPVAPSPSFFRRWPLRLHTECRESCTEFSLFLITWSKPCACNFLSLNIPWDADVTL